MTILHTIIAPPAEPQRRSEYESNPRAGEILASLRELGSRPIDTWQLLERLARTRQPRDRDHFRFWRLMYWRHLRELLRSRAVFRHGKKAVGLTPPAARIGPRQPRRSSPLHNHNLRGPCVGLAKPALDQMVSDVRAGRVERVVCYKLDRLGRSVAHLALLMEELIKLHVPLIVTSQAIDTSEDNAAGRLQAHVIMAMAEFERSLIRERVRAGLAAARERGVRLGRKPVLVKRVDDVRRLREAGLGIRAIGRKLRMAPSSVYKVWKLAASRSKVLVL